jgi:hypothetical protein
MRGFTNAAHDPIRRVTIGDFEAAVPDFERSERASDDQMIGRLRSVVPSVFLPEKIFYVERTAVARIKRAYTAIHLGAELTELPDVRQQKPTNLFLISVWQVHQLRNCQFKALDHGLHPITRSLFRKWCREQRGCVASKRPPCAWRLNHSVEPAAEPLERRVVRGHRIPNLDLF